MRIENYARASSALAKLTAHDAELVALHLVNFLERAGELTPAAAEMLERLGPTAARLNEFYERLMAQSGQ